VYELHHLVVFDRFHAGTSDLFYPMFPRRGKTDQEGL
jgi:hypothetical protein